MLQTIARNSESSEHAIGVATFLREIQAQLEEHAVSRGTDLAIERAPADLRAMANEGALHQILLNLVDTATRCVVAGSNIRMWCESNARLVAVRIRCGACSGLRLTDQAVISATRELARNMGGDVKFSDCTYTVELQRTA
jgi:C4-dicarboxylate-specific signal transduction histidine kinase